jgi:hypothetical protein
VFVHQYFTDEQHINIKHFETTENHAKKIHEVDERNAEEMFRYHVKELINENVTYQLVDKEIPQG